MSSLRFSFPKALLLALWLLIPFSSHATLIEQGDSFRFGIDLSDATPPGPYSYISWYVNASPINGIDGGEKFSFALYDDANAATALGSGMFDWTSGGFTLLSAGSTMASDPVFDGTGYLEFTMLSGSMDLMGGMVLGLNNGVTSDGLSYIEILPSTATSVPEPGTLSLIGLALLVFALFVKLDRRTREASLHLKTV
jgi:hypothetical protein